VVDEKNLGADMGFLRLGLWAIAITAVFTGSSLGHEGHDHGDTPPPSTLQISPRATAASALFELVAVSSGSALTVYLDRFGTNEPVAGARLDVETPSGPVTATADGDVYKIDAPWASTPGEYELLFTVTADAEIDFLTGTMSVPQPLAVPVADSGSGGFVGAAIARQFRDAVATTVPQRISQFDPALIFMGIAGFLGGALAMGLVRRRKLAAGLFASLLAVLFATTFAYAQTASNAGKSAKVAIRDVAQRLADGRVFAPKSAQRILAIRTIAATEAEHRSSIEMPGRVIPDPNESGFVQTAIGGRLLPPPGGFPPLGAQVKAGQLMAFIEPSLAAADQSSIRQSKGELDQDIALEERQLDRLRTLAKSGTASARQLEEAELTLEGLRKRRAALAAIRMEPERLVAPVSGIVSKANAAPGLIAETNTEVFHIINPGRLWVEALSFGRNEVSGSASIGALDGSPLTLTLVGAGFAEDGQAQPVHFRVEDGSGRLQPGDRVTLVAQTQAITKGIAAPREAVIRAANGADIVFVHTAPELFESRAVRTEPLDGGRVIIVAGIKAGERFVTQGAELLNQLR
jgi:membrane fusion protein, heavy metal efflux system